MRLLDLFCCGGGAAMGYHRAGWDVVGVDKDPQPHYPFEFHQADALEFLAEHGHEFHAVHASPPCRDHTDLAALHGDAGTGWLLPASRDALDRLGLPYVIENVEGAPMRADLILCGSMFGLGAAGFVLRRHRLFESNTTLTPPGPDTCAGKPLAGVYGGGPQNYGTHVRTGRGVKLNAADARTALGIDWLGRDRLSQAIPPAYTKWIGHQLLGAARVRA